jgi:hypothetical protein
MDDFCLLVAIPRLREPAKYDRFSVWFLNPGLSPYRFSATPVALKQAFSGDQFFLYKN